MGTGDGCASIEKATHRRAPIKNRPNFVPSASTFVALIFVSAFSVADIVAQ